MSIGDDTSRNVEAAELMRRCHDDLMAEATRIGVPAVAERSHDELVAALLIRLLETGRRVHTDGVLTVLPEGFGFVRMLASNYTASAVDAYVSPSQVRNLGLGTGHRLQGPVRAPRGTERFFALEHVERVQGDAVERLPTLAPFAARTPLVATRPLPVLTPHSDEVQPAGDDWRTLAALAPWCLGQRVLVTAPAGWSCARWLAQLAGALRRGNKAATILLALLEQRPEDIAHVRARLCDDGCDVVASDFGDPADRHLATAEIAFAFAQREVEQGRDVVLLLDSLTSMTRAAGRVGAPSGAWAHPGLDARALLPGKRLFAGARQCQEGGSLTVIASANVAPGAAVDEAVRGEFAVYSNSDVVVDAGLSTAGAAAPFDLLTTRTRREDDVRPPLEQERWRRIRAAIADLPAAERHARWLAGLRTDFASPSG